MLKRQFESGRLLVSFDWIVARSNVCLSCIPLVEGVEQHAGKIASSTIKWHTRYHRSTEGWVTVYHQIGVRFPVVPPRRSLWAASKKRWCAGPKGLVLHQRSTGLERGVTARLPSQIAPKLRPANLNAREILQV